MTNKQPAVVTTSIGLVLVLASCIDPQPPRLEVNLDSSTSPYCQQIDFSRGWEYSYSASGGLPIMVDYEVRDGRATQVFLIGAILREGSLDMTPTEKYRVDLSGASASVRLASEEEWREGPILPLVRESIQRRRGPSRPEDQLVYEGATFPKTGEHWVRPEIDTTRLSPDGSMLVVQSRDIDRGGEQAFFDIYDVNERRKLLTIEGEFHTPYPDNYIRWSFWLTDRYFVIPVGGKFEGAVFCDLDSVRSEQL